MKEIHNILKSEKEKSELEKIEHVENSKDDSSRMFRTIRLLNKNNKRENVYIEENDTALDNKKSTEKITKFFKELFNQENICNLENIKPAKMRLPFTGEEVKIAIRSLKNNKSPGPDNLPAEIFKNCPEALLRKIADMFNKIAETGQTPDDMELGFLIPLQKMGKKKGKAENLRPIILLNIIRKVLAIVMLNRIGKRIDNEVPVTQTAYRKGRSTTENIFTFKILAEKQ